MMASIISNGINIRRCSHISSVLKLPYVGGLASQQQRSMSFIRYPKKVIPAEKDRGKLSIKQYVKTVGLESNPEVIAEHRAISKIIKESKHNEAVLGEKLSGVSKGSINASRKKSEDVEEDVCDDPEIKKALSLVHHENYETTPLSAYRGYLRNCQTKKKRNESNMIMLEGSKLIREAIAREMTPVAVYFSRKKLLLDIMPESMEMQEKIDRLGTYMTFKTHYKTLSQWSSTVKSQGIVGIFNKTEAQKAYSKGEKLYPSTNMRGAQLTVVLDSVREPGNVGAVLRTCGAVGARRVLLTKGCCDPWEAKALRAGCGAQFTVELITDVPWNQLSNHVPECPTVFLADICNADRDPMKEECGVEEEEEQVAGWGVSRSRARKEKEELQAQDADLEEEAEDSDDEPYDPSRHVKYIEDEEGNSIRVDTSYDDPSHLAAYADADIPAYDYRSATFFPVDDGDDIVLVVGAETGLSASAVKLAADNDGARVNIPLLNGVDSLNTSVAAGVLLYEVLAQTQTLKRPSSAAASSAAASAAPTAATSSAAASTAAAPAAASVAAPAAAASSDAASSDAASFAAAASTTTPFASSSKDGDK